MKLRTLLTRWTADYAADDRGNTAAIVAICIVFLLGTAAMATDLGYTYMAKLKLQASADAAALAGAQMINTSNTTMNPIAEATTYSAVAGNKNTQANFTASMQSGYPKLVCSQILANQNDPCITGFPGAPPAGANAIQVVENAQVPSFFSKVFGVPFFTVSATSTAAAQGGQPKPLAVEVILDTTASMNSADNGCGLAPGSTRVDCAKAGLQALLMGLSPSVQYVGLFVFPGFANNVEARKDYACSGGTPTTVPYFSAPLYQVTALNNDFKSSNSATTLQGTSQIVKAAGGNTGCSQGVQAPGGQGTYYAQAIHDAQADLNANAPAGAAKAIVLLSDGEANAHNGVQSITVTNGGTNYNAPPNVVFTNNGGSGATATAVMSGSGPGQHVASVTITAKGNGYSYQNPPTIAFQNQPGKTGSGATGTVVLTNPPGTQQCHQAVTQAQTATAAGTTFFAVAYGSSTNASDCSTDSAPQITPCTALQQMATSLADFYSDGSGGTSCPNAKNVTSLASAFGSIATAITSVRLVPDSWAP